MVITAITALIVADQLCHWYFDDWSLVMSSQVLEAGKPHCHFLIFKSRSLILLTVKKIMPIKIKAYFKATSAGGLQYFSAELWTDV